MLLNIRKIMLVTLTLWYVSMLTSCYHIQQDVTGSVYLVKISPASVQSHTTNKCDYPEIHLHVESNISNDSRDVAEYIAPVQADTAAADPVAPAQTAPALPEPDLPEPDGSTASMLAYAEGALAHWQALAVSLLDERPELAEDYAAFLAALDAEVDVYRETFRVEDSDLYGSSSLYGSAVIYECVWLRAVRTREWLEAQW